MLLTTRFKLIPECNSDSSESKYNTFRNPIELQKSLDPIRLVMSGYLHASIARMNYFSFEVQRSTDDVFE